jgi:hypothetical protein
VVPFDSDYSVGDDASPLFFFTFTCHSRVTHFYLPQPGNPNRTGWPNEKQPGNICTRYLERTCWGGYIREGIAHIPEVENSLWGFFKPDFSW